jgi:hypothetical protein
MLTVCPHYSKIADSLSVSDILGRQDSEQSTPAAAGFGFQTN